MMGTPEQYNTGVPLYGELGSSQQALKVDWAEKINLVSTNKFEAPGSMVALCGINVNPQCSAFGMKDGSIQIISNDGQSLSTLR